MKVIYELDLNNEEGMDEYIYQQFKIADDMHLALLAINDYLRELDKGFKEDDKDKIIDTIRDLISQSKIYEVE